MRSVKPARLAVPAFVICILIGFFNSSEVLGQAEDLGIQDYRLVSKMRVGRTSYDYAFKADIVNKGTQSHLDVVAKIATGNPAILIVDGSLEFGDVEAGAVVGSMDTFTVRVDRRILFDPAQVSWSFGYAQFGGIGLPSLEPPAIAVNLPTAVVVRARVSSPDLGRATLVLKELDSRGIPVRLLGILHDDGQDPDELAGDSLFSGRIAITAESIGDVAVAAFASGPEGSFFMSKEVTLEIVPPWVPNRPAVSDSEIVEDQVHGQRIACDRVLVVFREEASFDAIQTLIGSVGGNAIGRMPQIRLWQLEVPCTSDATSVNQTIELLEADELVESAEADSLGELASNDPYFSAQWALNVIHAPEAWMLERGRLGTTIAVVDSGVSYAHEDLDGKFLTYRGYDYFENDDDPVDSYGHGTAVAGIAAASTDNGKGVAGACPGCRLLAERVGTATVGPNGTVIENVKVDAVAAGILDAVTHGARVINLSLAFQDLAPCLEGAVLFALRNNCTIIASAGNYGSSALRYPAAYAGVIAVGSVGRTLLRSAFSSYGSWVDVYAPGSDLASKPDVHTTSRDGGYGFFNGTSAAAPFVSGTVGLMLTANPELNPAQVEKILRDKAVPTGKLDPDGNEVRVLNASEAVGAALQPSEETGFSWWQAWPQSSPEIRYLSALAFDALRGETVLFGGLPEGGVPTGVLNDTWVWSGHDWARRFPSRSPEPRYYHAMASSTARGEVVLFGGLDRTATFVLGDTWVWNGSTWLERSPLQSPAPRRGHAMVYDPIRREVVLFGGTGGDGTALADTWIWDGQTWTQRHPATTPPGRLFHSLAFDKSRQTVVMYGGVSQYGEHTIPLDDIWLWNGQEWNRAQSVPNPGGRLDFGLATSSSEFGVVLFGGEQPVPPFNGSADFRYDTWLWNGGWQRLSSATEPFAIDPPSILMANDERRGEVVLFGVNITSHDIETWVLRPSN